MKPQPIRIDEILNAQRDAAAQEALRKIESEMRTKGEEKPPEGFHDTDWWAAQWGLGISRARVNLKRGVQVGVIETAKYRTWVGCRMQRVDYYRVVEQPKKR
jgi:hypothetical protein